MCNPTALPPLPPTARCPQVFVLGGKSYLLNFKQRQENARVLFHIFALCPATQFTTKLYPMSVFPGAGGAVSSHAPLDALVDACGGSRSSASYRPRRAPTRFITPAQLVERMEWARLWARRDISNFDYFKLDFISSGKVFIQSEKGIAWIFVGSC